MENNNFLNVRPVLNRAIQTIQKIAFNVDAIRHPEALDREVIVESNHGTVLIRWRVRALVDWTTGTLTPDSTGSSLFYWSGNYLAGPDSYIIAWEANTITSDVSGSAIIWGTNNTLITWSNIYIIWGSGNTISWVNSYIVWWHDNVLEWNDSYIIWGSFSEVHASWSIAAGSDIYIDKDNVFAWKDTSDDVKLNPKKDNTFILFAQNWISIWYWEPQPTQPWTVDIRGTFQVATERKRCGINIAGAIQYIPLVSWDVVAWEEYQGHLYGCFCTCDWSEWVSMVPTRKCRDLCPIITWAVDEDFQKWVCRYTKGQKGGGQNVSIWSIDPSQACDNWEATGFVETVKDWYPASWSWSCVGNETTATDCWADAVRQAWKCSVNPNRTDHADYYNKCDGWYPTKLQHKDSGLYTWTCSGVNAPDSSECKACKENWNYVEKNGKWQCVDQNGRCNGNFNGKDLASLSTESLDSNWVWLCSYTEEWATITLKETQWEDWKQDWWIWSCKWEQSTAQCKATYKVDPWRCKATNATWISVYGTCENGEFTGLQAKDDNNIATWTCAWINHPTSVECKWCPSWYKYNRKKGICEKTCCEFEPWVFEYLDGEYSWYIVANTCHTSVTLKDRNIWAQMRYDWTKWASYEDLAVGNYFQRGNNYWFTLKNGKVEEEMTTERPTWDDVYCRSWYYGNQFIYNKKNEVEKFYYNYWAEPVAGKKVECKAPGEGDYTVHRDIWWWGIDWYVSWCYGQQFWMDTLHKYHTNDIVDYIYDRKVARHCYLDVTKYMLDTWATARQWPCPEWRHVPSAWEWWALLTAFCEDNPEACRDQTASTKTYKSSLSKWVLTRSVANDSLGREFSKKFYLPKWGRILADSTYPGTVLSKNDEGFYWSSSYTSDEYVWYLWFNKAQIYATQSNGESKRWAPIRCFKDPVKIDDDDPLNKCPDPHILTINYVTEEWRILADQRNEELGKNESYSITSPTIEGYTADQKTVSWKMPNKDLTIDVIYTENKKH